MHAWEMDWTCKGPAVHMLGSSRSSLSEEELDQARSLACLDLQQVSNRKLLQKNIRSSTEPTLDRSSLKE